MTLASVLPKMIEKVIQKNKRDRIIKNYVTGLFEPFQEFMHRNERQ